MLMSEQIFQQYREHLNEVGTQFFYRFTLGVGSRHLRDISDVVPSVAVKTGELFYSGGSLVSMWLNASRRKTSEKI